MRSCAACVFISCPLTGRIKGRKVVKGIMPKAAISGVKSHNCVRHRSFYDHSRSCGVAKNLWILAQLIDEFHLKEAHHFTLHRYTQGAKSEDKQQHCQLNKTSLPTALHNDLHSATSSIQGIHHTNEHTFKIRFLLVGHVLLCERHYWKSHVAPRISFASPFQRHLAHCVETCDVVPQ